MVKLININVLLGSFGTVMLCNKAATDKYFFIVYFTALYSTPTSRKAIFSRVKHLLKRMNFNAMKLAQF